MYTVQTSGRDTGGGAREKEDGASSAAREGACAPRADEAREGACGKIRLCALTAGWSLPLYVAAREDHHEVIAPTHVVVRTTPRGPDLGVEDEVVGYASLGGHQLFFAWLHTKKLNKHESFRAWRLAEELAAGKGLVMAVSPNSPLLPYVERMGYQRLGPAVLFIKR